jgi:hypothetical protein
MIGGRYANIQYFNPKKISDLTLWLDANDPMANGFQPSSGTSLPIWIDKSGKSNSASQMTGGNQPTFNTSVQNGLPGIQFNGISANMLGTLPTLPSDPNFTVCCAMIDTSSASTSAFFGVGSVDAVIDSIGFAKNAGVNYFNVFDWGAVEARYSPDTSSAVVFVGGRDLSLESPFIYINGLVGFTTGGSDLPTINTSYTVGSHSNVDFPFYLTGYVLEICVYQKVLSTQERTMIQRYLGNKWGVAVP